MGLGIKIISVGGRLHWEEKRCREGRQRPALLQTSDLAAENKMFGSLFLMEVPKPAYMPFYFAWIFMQRNRMAISLFSSRV